MLKVTEFEPFIPEDRHQRLHQSSKGKNPLKKQVVLRPAFRIRRALLFSLYNEEQKEAAYRNRKA